VTRKAHLVGSIPGANAREAMEAALTRLAPHLLTLTDGETGARSWWIGACLQNVRNDSDVEVARDGDFSDYDNTLLFRLKDGMELDVQTLESCLPYEAAFEENFGLFKTLREQYKRPDLPFQVGIPAHLDLSVDMFGFPEGLAPHLYGPSLEATRGHVAKIQAVGASDVLFQIETPAALVAVVGASDEDAPNVARGIAGKLVDLPARAPVGTRFGVHLCLGDMNHKALGRLSTIRPAVLVANALASAWPVDRPLEFIHMPFAQAELPPTFDVAFYEPLTDLAIPETVRFVAGCIHESLTFAQQREVLELIDRYAGREADVAAACGLGRRPDPNQAWDAMEKARHLVTGDA
jgi:hypothetical protein